MPSDDRGNGPIPTPLERLAAVLNERIANHQLTDIEAEAIRADTEHLDAASLAVVISDLEAGAT